MLTISCSNLEAARKNPLQYGEQMALQKERESGGGHGMLSYWKDTVIHILKKEVTVSAAKRNLAHTLSGFTRTDKNIQKEKSLLDSLDKYLKSHEKNRFSIVTGARAIRWNIIESVRLSGFTPITVAKPDQNLCILLFSRRQSQLAERNSISDLTKLSGT